MLSGVSVFPGGIVGVLQGSQPQLYESWWPFSNRANSLKKQAMEKEKQTRLYLFFVACGFHLISSVKFSFTAC